MWKLGPEAKLAKNHCFKVMHKKMTLVLHDKAWTCSKCSMQCTIQMLSNNNHCFDVAKSGGGLVGTLLRNQYVQTTFISHSLCVCCRDQTNENLWDSCSPSWERKRASHPLYSHSMTQTDSLINRYLIQAWFKDAYCVWMDSVKVCMCLRENLDIVCVY